MKEKKKIPGLDENFLKNGQVNFHGTRMLEIDRKINFENGDFDQFSGKSRDENFRTEPLVEISI